MNIDIIINNLELKYYTSLHNTLNKNNTEIEWLKIHINKLNGILTTDTETIKKNDKTDTIISIQQPNDNDLFKKSWTKLNLIHKVIKIKEFVNNIKIDTEIDRENLKDELISLVKTKVLTKKDKIIYDEENGKIISLVNLQYKDGKYFYSNE
jgi:hypothetical protein